MQSLQAHANTSYVETGLAIYILSQYTTVAIPDGRNNVHGILSQMMLFIIASHVLGQVTKAQNLSLDATIDSLFN